MSIITKQNELVMRWKTVEYESRKLKQEERERVYDGVVLFNKDVIYHQIINLTEEEIGGYSEDMSRIEENITRINKER